MSNATQFLLDESQAGVGPSDAPSLVRVRQQFDRPVEADIEAAIQRELTSVLERVSAGQHIAITGSSRGVSNFATVIKTCVTALRERGAQPFVVPGMGSHGGATAQGQLDVLANTHGITEASLGCPVRSSMEVVQIGTTNTGFPVYQDKNAYDADGILVVNRIKPHTGFTEKVESGICKMLVIGLGKQAGASKIHQQALRVPMGDMILDASKIILEAERPKLVGALGLVENAFKETAEIKALPVHAHDALVAAESKLLERAYALLPRLPFEALDGLVVDEMGKDVSGSGMDTNVIGKKPGMTRPNIGAIYLRGLTEATHGNATGIGNADIMPRWLFDHVDLNSTYMNSFTAKSLRGGKIPMLMENELQALQVIMNFRQDEAPDSVRVAWIKNTSKLDEMWVSSALLEELRDNPNIEILSQPSPLGFDGALNFVLPNWAATAAD